jgi:lysophospholipase L1-like esterase
MKVGSILRELVKIIAATVVFFALVESLFRVAYFLRNSMVDYVVLPYNAAQDFGPIPPWLDGLRILEHDDSLFWKGRPNLQRKYMDVYSPVHVEEDRTALLRQFIPSLPSSLRENPVWQVSLNSQGFRSADFPDEKKSSSFRILCVGDSWTFGANVDQNKAYPQRLQALLRAEFPDEEFEVFNLGVLAYSSYQGLRLLKRKALDLKPDMLLIGFGMNDASVAGYRDRDMDNYKSSTTLIKKVGKVLKKSECFKLAKYINQIRKHKSWSIGEYMQKIATVSGTTDEAWIGREGNESADYEKLEPYTRVSPRDYEKNIIEMIHLSKSHGAGVILLYNELWNTPYRAALENISNAEGVALVDSKKLIDDARARIEQGLEERLGLRPSMSNLPGESEEIQVIFRVYLGKRSVPKAIYIAGVHPKLGNGVPNHIRMFDDATHGDQRAGDNVWSYAAMFPPGRKILYVYTNSGEKGRWEGLDIPEIRRFTVNAANQGVTVFRPIEAFGEMYMQADGWHTNAAGYELIAKAILNKLKEDERVRKYVVHDAYE